ncbi:ATP synthase F1 subunit epsilon [Balneolales bacterium ANBcel1]|nr:ATP synthase F1 subunit epsilon [Balneolales bacterium ANBcel1]
MRANILTPLGPVFSGEVAGIRMPGADGSFEVLNNHAPLVALLDTGKMVIRFEEEEELLYAVSGGFTEVKDNQVTVLVEEAIPVSDIDLSAEKVIQENLLSKMRELKVDSAEHARAEKDLKKAVNKITLAAE